MVREVAEITGPVLVCNTYVNPRPTLGHPLPDHLLSPSHALSLYKPHKSGREPEKNFNPNGRRNLQVPSPWNSRNAEGSCYASVHVTFKFNLENVPVPRCRPIKPGAGSPRDRRLNLYWCTNCRTGPGSQHGTTDRYVIIATRYVTSWISRYYEIRVGYCVPGSSMQRETEWNDPVSRGLGSRLQIF